MLMKGLVCYLPTDSPLNSNHNCPPGRSSGPRRLHLSRWACIYRPHEPCHLHVPFSHALTYLFPSSHPRFPPRTCVWPTERK